MKMMMEEKLRLYIRDMKNIIYIKDLIGVKLMLTILFLMHEFL